VAGGSALPVEVLAERLMLAIYGYGTNTGIRAVAAGGGHAHSEEQLRYARRRYLTREAAQEVAIEIANATFAIRRYTLWCGGSTAVASDSTEEQEMSVACLRILQAALVYVDTLLLQDVLAEPEWADLLTDQDRRGLTPLFWQHILPYGEVKLDMTTRLDIRTDTPISRP